MVKLILIISDVDKALAFEWKAYNLIGKIDLKFILIGQADTTLKKYLDDLKIPVWEITDKEYPGYFKKWIKVFRVLMKERPSIVHTHLWRATLIGITASWVLGIKKRIFTRHHATIHYDQYPSGRKLDLLCNAAATHIIAISNNIKDILIQRDKCNPSKVFLIHHGFDFDYFLNISDQQILNVRAKYGLNGNYPVIGVISRYMEWKGIQYIIPAFKSILKKYPEAKLVLANAHGEFEPTITQLLKSLPENSFVEIRFEKDLTALYRLFDLYVHVPIDPFVEAFGQTYIEALLTGVPSIFSLSGVAREFIRNKENALVVDFKSSKEIEEALLTLLGDSALRDRLKQNGIKAVQQFSMNEYILALETLYKSER